VLGWDGSTLCEVADLSSLASYHCNDMVVDSDDSVRVAADLMAFPNGTVITPDGATMIVG
jgi:sugar lactone lactonase YvrE